jgi:tetratricopeptide (TPR) repeat protein
MEKNMSGNQSSFSLLGKIASYTEILAKDPHSTVFVPLCEAYRQMGLLDDALDIALKGTQVLPGFSPGFTALGRIQAQQGNLEEATLAFEKALSLDRNSLASLKGLAKVRSRLGGKEQARDLLLRAAALQPEDDGVRRWLDQLGPQPSPPSTQPDQGEEDVPSPPSPRPGKPKNDPISTGTIAEIYVRQGFLKRAAKIYRDLLQSDPHNEDIRQKLVALKKRILADEGGTAALGDCPGEMPEVEMQTIAPVSQDPPQEDSDGKEKQILTTLEGWLDSIRRGREHV